MSMEYFVLGVFTVVLIAQNIFWAKLCLSLTNRIMSRSYEELKQAERKPISLVQEEPDLNDPIAERQAKELNSMLGMA